MSTVKELVEKYAEHAIEIRRDIHNNPELSNKEFRTTELIKRELTSYGIEIQDLPGMKTGVTAVIYGGKPGKTVGLREDIDALPMQEKTGLPFASSCDGVAHACGHDIHTSGLLLAARVLQDMREELCGNVRLIFQPCEEGMGGAEVMIKAGVMELEPKVDCVLGFHCSPEYDGGCIGVIKNAANASVDGVSITVKGKGGHGAHPYRCVDPIATAAYLITQLQTIISRENPAVQPAVLTFGMIHGGTAMNIIPAEVELKGTLRAFDPVGRNKIKDAIVRLSTHCCEAMRAEAVVEFGIGCPPVINDVNVMDLVIESAKETIGAEHICPIPAPSPGSDDIACFGEFVPTAQFRVGSGNSDPNSRHGLHNPNNIFDEKAISTGAAVLAQYAVNYLK